MILSGQYMVGSAIRVHPISLPYVHVYVHVYVYVHVHATSSLYPPPITAHLPCSLHPNQHHHQGVAAPTRGTRKIGALIGAAAGKTDDTVLTQALQVINTSRRCYTLRSARCVCAFARLI